MRDAGRNKHGLRFVCSEGTNAMRLRGISFVFAMAFAGCTVAGCANSAISGAAPSPSRETQIRSAGSASLIYAVHPTSRLLRAGSDGLTPMLTLSQCVSGVGLSCFTPTSIKSGYNFPSSASGAGATIAIVDAFGNPTVTADLHAFDLAVGLADPSAGQFQIVYPGGKPTFNPTNRDQLNWAIETDLDVQWAHAIAPSAAIVLVVAANSNGNSINTAEEYVVENLPGSIMSLSFGIPESTISGGGNNTQLQQAHQTLFQATQRNITALAASGDGGATALLGSVPDAYYPASDPLVIAVGGTDLKLFNNGSYRSEKAWNDFDDPVTKCTAPVAPGATGGAPSAIFTPPPYQTTIAKTLGMTGRTTSDVAFNASACTGVVVYLGFQGLTPGIYAVGGTSQAVPQWAGILAAANAANGAPLGFVTNRIYAIGGSTAFHDITNGDNVTDGFGYQTAVGYDLPTGWGTPNVANFVPALLSAAPGPSPLP